MADKDNWDSFFEDDTDRPFEDDWESINTNDFDDIPTISLSNDFSNVDINEEPSVVSDDFQDLDEEFSSETEFKDDFDDAFEDNDDFDDDEEEKPSRLRKEDAPKSKSPLMIILIALISVGLIVAAVILIVKGVSCGGTSFKENSPSEILEVVNKYYNARIQQDTYTLKEVLPSDITISEDELKNEASIIEGYQDITIYTTNGVNEGDYVVFVSFDVKFKNIETPAPGFVDAYAMIDSDGTIKFIPHEYISKLSIDIQNCIADASESDTIKELVEETNIKYEEALNSDAALKEYVESKFGSSNNDSSDETSASAETTTAAAETTTASKSSDLEGEDPSSFTSCDETWYTSDDVRVREQPNTNESTGYSQVTKGTRVRVIGKGTQWAHVQLTDGSDGYIAIRYLTANNPN